MRLCLPASATSAKTYRPVQAMAPQNDRPASVRPPAAPRLFSRLSHASKRSFLSHSTSFEADDERSDTASFDEYSMMSGSRSRRSSGASSSGGRSSSLFGGGGLFPARYPGDDTRPTSSKELAGWYAYAFAAEVYVICG